MASTQLSEHINEIETTIILLEHADRILILITQLGKVGNLIQASIPPTASFLNPPTTDSSSTNSNSNTLESLPLPPPSILLTPLFGAAPSSHLATLHNLYASQVATLYWTLSPTKDTKAVITGIALKRTKSTDDEMTQVTEEERKTFGEIMNLVKKVIGKHFNVPSL